MITTTARVTAARLAIRAARPRRLTSILLWAAQISLAALSHLLHTSFDASAVLNTRASYPPPGNYVAPRPVPQPSLHP